MTEIKTIEQTQNPLVEKASSLVITDDSTMKEAVSLLSQLNLINDRIAEVKDKVLKPLLEATKAERARWKPTETLNQSLIDSIRAKMTSYQTNLVNTTKAKETQIASRIGEGKGKLKLETAIARIEALPVVEKETSTNDGLVQFAEVKKFEVFDMTLLPLKYHLPDEIAIRKEMKEGREIEGVKYWVEQQPRNYR